MRYRGQAYELTVPLKSDHGRIDMAAVGEDFGAVHARRYGHRADAEEIEIVNLRVSAAFSLGKPRPLTLQGVAAPAQPKERLVRFLSGAHLTPVFWRESLPPGFAIEGPVIIEEKTSTVAVEPGWRLSVDQQGNLLLHSSVKGEGLP